MPPLPYAFDALEPYIDAQTMTLHRDKHHAAYVKNLNAAVAKLPPAILIGGGHYNHSLFWQMMTKGGGGKPTRDLASAIDKQFGSYTQF